MSERKLVVDHAGLSYEGLFDVHELYMMIDKWLKEKGFDKREMRNVEQVSPNGKYVELELQPWKKITDYAKHIIRMDIKILGIKDVEVRKDGHKVKLQKAKVSIIFDGYLETDWEHRWEQQPMYIFIRTLFDKFVYNTYSSKFEAQLVESVNDLRAQIKSFLNLYKY